MKKKELRAGDVILFPPHKGDFIAQAIAFLTDGEVNHAALCYPKGNDLMVAESILKCGLVLNPFPEYISAEYPLRICRMKNQNNLKPVLVAVQKYLEEHNAYPNFNLGLLGVLLLFKKLAPHTLGNRIMYQFSLLVANELMKLVQKRKYKGKHPMSCSQFVAQCFTDAGEGYDLNFRSLIADFIVTEKNGMQSCSKSVAHDISVIEMMEAEDCSIKSLENLHVCEDKGLIDYSEEKKEKLTSDFINLIRNQEATNDLLCLKERTDYLSVLQIPMKHIAFSIYELQTGNTATDLKTVFDYLKSSTARNYFVSPQDIFANCPKSLEYVGNLSY